MIKQVALGFLGLGTVGTVVGVPLVNSSSESDGRSGLTLPESLKNDPELGKSIDYKMKVFQERGYSDSSLSCPGRKDRFTRLTLEELSDKEKRAYIVCSYLEDEKPNPNFESELGGSQITVTCTEAKGNFHNKTLNCEIKGKTMRFDFSHIQPNKLGLAWG
ncbi:hypothetical protein MHLP_01120 [Candidatus Mycoplasma haematolamae str. Purdue]|uniref:Uncharacterized protein n=1 Tax=Mycoplasma haematolamae (strain Purdue) TaxID=1212765 RepID=I7CIV4_MYCHA|nr:hypothetical protein [Candidatus Mycoplasma haematolamae]AFO51804.1 hypothetical protein MHLP_01120 [Candidatus Mycoplasma haematolamae str. Purdue]